MVGRRPSGRRAPFGPSIATCPASWTKGDQGTKAVWPACGMGALAPGGPPTIGPQVRPGGGWVPPPPPARGGGQVPIVGGVNPCKRGLGCQAHRPASGGWPTPAACGPTHVAKLGRLPKPGPALAASPALATPHTTPPLQAAWWWAHGGVRPCGATHCPFGGGVHRLAATPRPWWPAWGTWARREAAPGRVQLCSYTPPLVVGSKAFARWQSGPGHCWHPRG